MFDDLINDLARYSKDPLGWVYWAFPWGEPYTDLANANGPEQWQKEVLLALKEGLIDINQAIQLATKSGHGIGKSALVSWIILWAISTMTDTRGVVTANTETQLKTKTWVELATWHRRFIARDLFKLKATSLFSADPAHAMTWRIDMVPWSERNTEAFAGLHNQGRRLILIMDEASAIPDMIWEVAEGALTDENTEIIWACFGNPTRNQGRFRDCFPGGQFAQRWRTFSVDSREVSFTNKTQIATWIEDYGDDSDFVRIRVKGAFPRIDAESFIPFNLAMNALNRVIEPQGRNALILGVDVARFGDDASVIYPRRGRDGSSFNIGIHFGLDTMQLAARVAETYNELRADSVMVDGGGVGGGVVDRLRQLRVPVMEVDFGSSPDNTNMYERSVKYANKRAEIWGEMRDWLKFGSIREVAIPQLNGTVVTLVDELTGPQYGLNNREAIQLEQKKDMRKRGVPSPNVADALACTFAYPAAKLRPGLVGVQNRPTVLPDYDPFTHERIYGDLHTQG